MTDVAELTGSTTELLQALIRNQCVNDGTPDSGDEVRNAELLETFLGSAWLATILWNIASQRLSASLCGQLIVSETLFALAYSFAWDGRWPTWAQAAACVLFTLGILASIKAHR